MLAHHIGDGRCFTARFRCATGVIYRQLVSIEWLIPVYIYTWLTSLVLRRIASVRNLFIPSIFDLVISGLFELKIHTDRRRIRTFDYECCMIVRTADYHSAIRRFCNHCLKWKYPNAYIKIMINEGVLTAVIQTLLESILIFI